jgi:membrane protein
MPFLLVSMALFFMYFFITNTRIGMGSTLVGAIFAGSLWQASQQTFIHYQIGVSKYNAIYGSFAQLPLFLFWLYISWVIVLLGAEISFCLSNSGASKDENQLGEFNLEDKERLGLAVVLYLISRLQSLDESCSPRELAKALNMPVKPVNRVLTALESLGWVAAVAGNNEERLVLIGCPQRVKVEEFLHLFRRFRETGDLSFSGPDSLETYCAQRREALDSAELNMSLEELSTRIFGARS